MSSPNLLDILNTRFGQLDLLSLGSFQASYKDSGTQENLTVHACQLETKLASVALVIAITPASDSSSKTSTSKLVNLNWSSLHLRSCKDFSILKTLLPVNWELLLDHPKQQRSARKLPEGVWMEEIPGLPSKRSKMYRLKDEVPTKHVISLETKQTNVDVGNGLLKTYEVDLVLDHTFHVMVKKL